MKRKYVILTTLMFFIALVSSGQSFSKKEKFRDFGSLNVLDAGNSKIIIESYVTRQNILTHSNYEQKIKTVSELPKYKYELILISKSFYNGISIKTWIFGAKVFINDIEVTREQFPEGFSVIIETEPTIIYWYETNADSVNFKISWQSSDYYKK